MKKINPKSSDIDSLKYSILILLHYYDISLHPERISKLKLSKNKYNLNYIPPNEFEVNNPNISLTVFDEKNNNITDLPENNSINKEQIVNINNNGYAAIKC